MILFEKVKYGFWKQINPKKFNYNIKYKQKQSTNIEMTFLRLGWLSYFFDVNQIFNMNVVDIGCGNHCFINHTKKMFKNIYGYDLAGDSITKSKLYNELWDMIIMNDVIEHFNNIDKLFKLKWKYAFISYPETPKVKKWEELKSWKHFKPNEHIWCLNKKGMIKWFTDNNCTILNVSSFEDLIRKRNNNKEINITDFLIKNNANI